MSRAPNIEEDEFEPIKELTLEDLRCGGRRLFAFTDDEWLTFLCAIRTAGGNEPSEPDIRQNLAHKIDRVLEWLDEYDKFIASKSLIIDVNELAGKLLMKLEEIDHAPYMAKLTEYKVKNRQQLYADRFKIKEQYTGLLQTIHKLVGTTRADIESRSVGRPEDWFTRLWCAALSGFIEEHCRIPRREARGRVNPKMVDVLDTIWKITRPPTGGRDNRRAIQIALSKLP